MEIPENHPDPRSWAPRRLKIYGERNSGTGYLRALLERNLRVECLRGGLPRSLRRLFPASEWIRDSYFRITRTHNLGWKHASAPTPDQLEKWRGVSPDLLFVTLSKNPYAWLLSLYRHPYHATQRAPSFDAFLSQPWETLGRENTSADFANPMELWNQKNASYLELGAHATSIHCRYEDLLVDPLRFLEELCREHGIAGRGRAFENVDRSTKRDAPSKTFDDYRDYYLNECWREAYSPDALARVNAALDRNLLSRLRYPLWTS